MPTFQEALGHKGTNLPIDKATKLPILTTQLVQLLVVFPEGNALLNTKLFLYKGIEITVVNENYMYPEDIASIQIEEGETLAAYGTTTYENEQLLSVPLTYAILSSRMTQASYKDTAADGSTIPCHFMFSCQKENLAFIIGAFSIYKGFGPVYDKYVRDPDDTVTLGETFIIEGDPRPNRILTTTDMKATAHVLLLLMSKTFTSGEGNKEGHIKSYVENRIKAIRFILHSTDAIFLFLLTNLDMIMHFWNMVPKLKRAVFKFAYRCRLEYPELNAAMVLLTDSSMVTIRCIKDFIQADMPTLAHLMVGIWEEAYAYMKERKRLEEELGDMWRFFRILHPDDISLSAAKFPNLAKASVMYVKLYINKSESFKKVKDPNHPTLPNLEEFVKVPLPDSYRSKEQADPLANLTPEVRAMAKTFGIAIEKYQTPSKLKAILSTGTDLSGSMEDVVKRYFLSHTVPSTSSTSV